MKLIELGETKIIYVLYCLHSETKMTPKNAIKQKYEHKAYWDTKANNVIPNQN